MRQVKRDGNSVTVTIEIKFDHLGYKLRMIDSDLGTIQYQYNGLGSVLWQQDAKNQRKCSIYDALGRIKKSFEVNTATCAKNQQF
ncbi:MAG: hypothetical protein GY787_19505 [Alteromonadales bacterium]|nr:hypothetical protein [Alteromonadales bacterium]